MKKTLIYLILFSISLSVCADVVFKKGENLKIVVGNREEAVVHTALHMFQQDFSAVFDSEAKISGNNGEVYIGTVGLHSKAESFVTSADLKKLTEHSEAFFLKVIENKIIVLGSDKRGTAYGILELSRMIGVSPWIWWADSPIEKKDHFSLKDGYSDLQYPSVAYRGIFINDEDWGLTPWSSQTYEPSSVKGQIGPKTHARIFELLLRLRANTFWPAMHSCSEAFYLTPGNKEVADRYGIFVGTSHCEPMMCNANGEWKQRGKGDYNYISNRENVLDFWKSRVSELAQSDNIYTLGMRGIHDGRMEGAKTTSEQKYALSKIITDQRKMLAEIKKCDVEKIPQVFIPYKEVLDAYNAGLKVPDDITLMWCDDNYGYITHFPDSIEKKRKGGNGIYYHVSYWGRPHDYLWLATTHPAQIAYQMKMAYDNDAKKYWILNVGDIKPAEYLIELFMDMAWNIHSVSPEKESVDNHLQNFLNREFGKNIAEELLPVMDEYYRLAFIRKPEFMGNTRTEEKDPSYKQISDFPWSEATIRKRINAYEQIENKVNELTKQISSDKQNSWFQLVKYPVVCASEMNKKFLYAQLARHDKSDWTESDHAYEKIVSLTKEYNNLNNGKWNRIMSCSPRSLPVFEKVPHTISSQPLPKDPSFIKKLNGTDYKSFVGEEPIAIGLGYENGAISVGKGSTVNYFVEKPNADSVCIDISFMPNHPVEDRKIRCAVSVNGGAEQILEYSTQGRSEEWKQNVLRNQALRSINSQVKNNTTLTIAIRALNEGVTIDQMVVSDNNLSNND